jgi:hypothetical protein
MYPAHSRRKRLPMMDNARDLEDRIRRAITRLEDVRREPGFEDVDVDRLRAVLESILTRLRRMELN